MSGIKKIIIGLQPRSCGATPATPTMKSDAELVARYRNGDEKALGELIARYLKPVYNFVWRMARGREDAEDITQEVFVKMWKGIKRYDCNRNFKTWLFTIARNTAIDALRKKKDFVFSDLAAAYSENPIFDTIADPAPLPSKLAARAEAQTLLEKALGKLSPAYQEIFTLHNEDDLTFDAIGTRLGKSTNTVKSQHRRAILALRKLLTAFGG